MDVSFTRQYLVLFVSIKIEKNTNDNSLYSYLYILHNTINKNPEPAVLFTENYKLKLRQKENQYPNKHTKPWNEGVNVCT